MQCGPPGPGAATQPIVPAHHLVDAWTFGMHAVGGAGWTGHQPGVPPASPPSATASVTGLHGEQQPTSSHDDNSDGCDACEGCPEPWLLAWAASAGAQPAPPAGSGAGAGTLVSAAQQAPQPMSLPGAAYFMQHQHQQQLLQTSLSGIPPSPAPGQPPSSSAGAAPSAKAAAASPGLALAEPPKLSRRQRMNERKLKELAAAKGEVESLTARQAELVAKLEELRADHRSLLDAVADITAKYQAAVTDNARLNRLLTAEQQQRQQQHATHQAAALPLPVLSQAPELGEGKQLWLPF